MTEEEFQRLYPVVLGWINQTLAQHFAQTHAVVSKAFPRIPQYFGNSLLRSAKFAIVKHVPVPPLSAWGLPQFSDFERGDYGGITYLDTFFIRSDHADEEGLYFHELIHVVQWRELGAERFIASYADGLERYGYIHSPLEKMAYEAEDQFKKSTSRFDAEKLVLKELSVLLANRQIVNPARQ
jgi:hypothetical protein